MSPNIEKDESVLTEETQEEISTVPKAGPRKYEIVYKNIIIFSYGHIAALYGLYLCLTSAKWQTILLAYVLLVVGEIGITAGAHRLWTHKSYKAKLPLEIILMVFNSIAFQNSAIDWIRDHRLHHKYSDTDADPHNATRGLFYSHVGWLLVRKHPEVKKRGRTIDLSDIYNNPVLVFQKKYAVPFIGAVCFALPTLIPMYFWGETLNNAWHLTMFRYVLNLNLTWLVNSAAHAWGYKPYDRNIRSAQNISVAIATLGEGFHNYHHVFPWDYRTAELGNNTLNLTTHFIDFFAAIGWAYDLKSVPEDMVRLRAERTGNNTDLWGLEVKNLPSEYKKEDKLINTKSDYIYKNSNKTIFTETFAKVKLASYTGHTAKLGDLKYNVFIVSLVNKWNLMYRAFCAGNIISLDRILTSSHCFLTNRKRYLRNMEKVKVVAGALVTSIQHPIEDPYQQWRKITKVFSQSYYRFPAYALAVVIVDQPFIFNNWVNSIPFASLNYDYDGICITSTVRPIASWSSSSSLCLEKSQMVTRANCENTLLRSCRLYYCTAYNKESADVSFEAEGGGLVCHHTGDPAEVDDTGVLVGVTVLINLHLPTLHHRIAPFRQWIIDSSSVIVPTELLIAMLLLLLVVK